MAGVLQVFPLDFLSVAAFGYLQKENLEQVAGNAPATVRWQRTELLLHHTCLSFLEIHPETSSASERHNFSHTFATLQPVQKFLLDAAGFTCDEQHAVELCVVVDF